MGWFIFTAVGISMLWFSKIIVSVHYKKDEVNDRIMLKIGLFNGLIPIRREFPMIKIKPKGILYKETHASKNTDINQDEQQLNTYKKIKRTSFQFQQFLKKVKNLHKITKRFLSKLKVVKLIWRSSIGTGDAAETGILSGLVWSIKSSILMAVRHYLDVKAKPVIIVDPSYVKFQLYTELECILQFRLGNAILAGIYILLNWRKGRDQRWQNTPSKV